MIEVAREKFPGVEFRVDDLEALQTDEKFDYILLVNVIGYVDDIQASLNGLKKICKPDTRIIVVYFNYLWQPILKIRRVVRPADEKAHYALAAASGHPKYPEAQRLRNCQGGLSDSHARIYSRYLNPVKQDNRENAFLPQAGLE